MNDTHRDRVAANEEEDRKYDSQGLSSAYASVPVDVQDKIDEEIGSARIFDFEGGKRDKKHERHIDVDIDDIDMEFDSNQREERQQYIMRNNLIDSNVRSHNDQSNISN